MEFNLFSDPHLTSFKKNCLKNKKCLFVHLCSYTQSNSIFLHSCLAAAASAATWTNNWTLFSAVAFISIENRPRDEKETGLNENKKPRQQPEQG